MHRVGIAVALCWLGLCATVLAQAGTPSAALQSGEAACSVHTLVVNGTEKNETIQAIRAHVGAVNDGLLVRAAEASMNDIDPRESQRIVGAPGGDMAEWLLVLTAYEKAANKTFTADDVQSLMTSYLLGTKKKTFTLLTDRDAVESVRHKVHFVKRLLDIRNPPVHVQPLLLEHLTDSRYQGSHFIQTLLERPVELGMRAELVTASLRAFYVMLWDGAHAAHWKAHLEIMDAERAKRKSAAGVLRVHVSPACEAAGMTALVAPLVGEDSRYYVVHPEAVHAEREAMVSYFAWSDAHVDRAALAGKVDELANLWTGEAMERVVGHAKPSYDLTFE